MADDKLPEGVIARDDGFFGVEGQPDSQYYADAETAARVARNIKIAQNAKK
jgi:hypothetical protein